jgi:polyketide synthase-like dehydratase family protein
VAECIAGPNFRGLTSIRQKDRAAVFEATIPDTRSSMPCNCESEYLIHPAMLDACLQVMLVTVPKTDDVPKQIWIPTAMSTIQISNDSILYNHNQVLHGFCESSRNGFREMIGSIVTANETFDSLPGIAMHGVTFMGLGTTQSLPQQNRCLEKASQASAKLCAEPSWKPDLDFLETTNAWALLGDNVAAPEGLVRFCSLASKVVEIMCQRVLQNFDPSTFSSLPAHLQKYVEWMRKRCNTLQDEKTPSTFVSSCQSHTSDKDDDSTIESFIVNYPFDGKICSHVFNFLDDIFKQKTTPLAVLMAEDNLHRFYQEAYGCISSTQIFRTWFDLKGHKSPYMRVIEIGAGTASATVPVLEQLGSRNGEMPRFSQWTFTDISTGWFQNAKILLHDWEPRVEYRRLDIEDDPVGQGFEAESYDVVLAVNVGD